MQVTTIGVDLAKNVFQVHGITANEEVVFNKPLRRAQFLPFFAKLEQKSVNLNHLTLPEIKDFNALSDALCCRLNGFRSRTLFDRHGVLQQRPSLGPRIDSLRPRGAFNPTDVCEALCQAREVRCNRRRGNL